MHGHVGHGGLARGSDEHPVLSRSASETRCLVWISSNPSARTALHARGMPRTCYGMQHQPFRPSHNRCTAHRLRVGHTPGPSGLPLGVQPGTLPGVIFRRDCCWHRCAHAKCTDFPGGALTRHACCPTAAILCGVRSRYPTTYGGVRGCGPRRVGRLNPYSAVPSSLPSKLV
jgi:hypothetical protein